MYKPKTREDDKTLYGEEKEEYIYVIENKTKTEYIARTSTMCSN